LKKLIGSWNIATAALNGAIVYSIAIRNKRDISNGCSVVSISAYILIISAKGVIGSKACSKIGRYNRKVADLCMSDPMKIHRENDQ
jgi:hypothetical protein